MSEKTLPDSPEIAIKTPRQRFVKSAPIRVNAVLEGLKKIAKLNSASYEYTERDLTAIETVLMDEVAVTMGILRGTQEAKSGFILPVD